MARYMVTALVTVLAMVSAMVLPHFQRRAAKNTHGAGAADLKPHSIPRISE